ncbi:4-hydroxyphenylpyruvate dioxygenase [Xanthomonas hortorum]|uniref:4-hydroxyphenylpyruvate dioxygenase n=2 Tax=Xanthomonas hortorum pv. pelargonii TaxID=453602 RepID=A0A6V7BPH7_9XANT|nr:4-hydroxyphenylpyruvate dioxygenase [Xanthomonas hortorum]MCE4355143.1 4-hydroxyphenylpyruvate dioxygenase [Xanthomonas hortorum pv. pelargonii]MCM5523348.1 4-hydroxyphenylpyruvate dioxygenase [Xanthomonas hortorum pv. pelargonii]MCM5535984.1 4-hydroxyphenylpyruvate dioxygenase [Xanthomonas hortorum pv. pelargonii]MCM5539985.1 4-hydroxyphenylpyruvate dioxygenase [Xanthomonas hortorum pv. pelargonii]MCM5544945.1 4-hydroxyphenylpyruvate dioxygenase [Xanthomonas hortorum pv. pelargonii]
MNAQPNTPISRPDPGMQVTTFDNPMGIDGFEFVEFAAPAGQAAQLHDYFRKMGFSPVLRHRSRAITVYRQGGVNFLLNEDPDSFAADFAAAHGPSACGFAIRFRTPAETVLETVLGNGGEAVQDKAETRAVPAPVVKGIGDCMLYLVDRYGDAGSIYDADYEPIPGADQHPAGFGLTFIDHLTHNLYFGNMQRWSDYYERLFNFREIRYFDIKGAKTGLVSKAMTAPDGIVRIPLNESSDPKSQINEYLDAYQGEGIQHIACFTDDIYTSVEKMREAGVSFLDTPDTYFDVVDLRIPEHGEDVARLRRNKILIDADVDTKQRKLLQIFTTNCIGPIFFEIIQRKGNEGFGEGNFQALFESIERDQMKRGVL